MLELSNLFIFIITMIERQKIISAVKNQILSIDPNAKIFLFGSRARNDFRKDSDWDFLILTQKKITRTLKNKISDLLFEIEIETGQVLTSIVQNPKAWNKYSNSPGFRNIVKDSIAI